MNKLTAYHYLVTLFLVLVLTVSCSQQDDTCRESRNVKLNATFYVDSINPDNRYVTEKFTVDSLTVQGVGKDSLIYNKKSTMYMELPLQIFAEESRFSLIINTISDTITIRYKNFLEFLSVECGSIRTHSIDTVFSTNHFIDSISIQQQKVNTIKIENIQIYHHK